MRRRIRLILALVPGLTWLVAMGPSLAVADVQKAIITPKGALSCVF